MSAAGLVFYGAATGLLEPLAAPLLRWRAARGKEDPARLGERLGRASVSRPEGPLVWLHGASVGEGLSLLPLVAALRPRVSVLVTTGTVTSARLLAERLPPGVIHQYAPVDAPAVAARFAGHWRPNLAIFVESEIWPNLIGAAEGVGARLALLSARLSRSSLDGWARAPRSAEALFSAFDLVMAQDDETASRLATLGARDDGRLNLKLAAQPLPVDQAALASARAAAGATPVLLAASTHHGEEALALEAFAPLRGRARLVIAPRHPARGEEIARLVAERGFSVRRQGAGEPFDAVAEVYVADALGQLGLWFSLARAAFVGGSLVAGPGGHNPLEPALLHCPVIAGPRVENWRPVYAAMQNNLYREVVSGADLGAAFEAALAGAITDADGAERYARTAGGDLQHIVNLLIKMI